MKGDTPSWKDTRWGQTMKECPRFCGDTPLCMASLWRKHEGMSPNCPRICRLQVKSLEPLIFFAIMGKIYIIAFCEV